jgi:cysteine desulfurase
MNSLPVYYDFASTTPVDPRVLEAMLPYFSELFGNPSSNHVYGRLANDAIEKARKSVADLINADTREIYFTSGATESINWALKGYLEANAPAGGHIITVKTEHKAVLNTCEYLETKGYNVTYLNVDKNGLISLEDLEHQITDQTKMVVVMYVNNEIGVIQSIPSIGGICSKHKVPFFCDATQAVGKIPVDVLRDQIDLLAMSAHKFYGPKGIGALYAKRGIKLAPLLHGGNQEAGLRSGTYNTPLIVGMGTAAEIAIDEIENRMIRAQEKRLELAEYFEKNKYGKLNFTDVHTSPFILSFTLLDEDAESFLIRMKDLFVASSGSACSSSIMAESHVKLALGLKNDVFRISIT